MFSCLTIIILLRMFRLRLIYTAYSLTFSFYCSLLIIKNTNGFIETSRWIDKLIECDIRVNDESILLIE